MDRLSPTAHAAYNDLARSLLDEAVSEVRGTPTRLTRAGRAYWYDSFRVGAEVKQRYIGEDSDELRERLSRIEALKDGRTDRAEHRARLVRLLRAERLLGVDAGTGGLLAAMAKAGVFRLGGTVVGTHAFRLYEGELGVRIGFDQTAVTNDVDIASFERLSLALGEAAAPSAGVILSDFAFDPAPSLDGAKTWRWRQAKRDVFVEFLTPSFSDEEGVRPLEALGVSAQALHFLNYLLAEPIHAAAIYRSGVLVQVPRPERFAIHKLIVADRRAGRDSLKARKDRLQAEFLIEALAEDRPDDLRDAYEDAMSRGPKWTGHLEKSLKSSPEAAARLREVSS